MATISAGAAVGSSTAAATEPHGRESVSPRPATVKQKKALYAMLREGTLTHTDDGPIDVEALTVAGASRLISLGHGRAKRGVLGLRHRKEDEDEAVD